MPSMKLFGRRWAVSSDDFVFPAITEGLLRSIWLIITLVVFALHPNDDCPAVDHLKAYIVVALVQNGLIIALSFSTAYVSSKGTIRNPVPRRRLPDLLYARFVLFLFEFIWNIVGAVWLSQSSDMAECDPAVVVAGKLTLIGSWLMVGVFLTGFWFVFDPLGHVHHDDVKMTDQAKRIWHWRLQLFCCCASGSDRAKSAFEDVAELLASFFGDTDLVWTDVLAGILILANRDLTVMNSRQGGGKVAFQSINQSPDDSEESAVPIWMNLRLASRMMEFALGVYGWPYYICSHGCALQPVCDLLHKLRCCNQCRCDNVIVIKDNCCQCNTAALLLHTGLSEMDIFHVNLHNEIWETPFVACLDHRTKSIVVAVRGSLSLRDAITDLCMREDAFQIDNTLQLDEPGRAWSADGVYVHKGMFWCARYIYSKLENEKILDDLFVLQPDYDLVVTGHSLGGGVAALLAILLKPKYSNVRCFAFSPPGCVISENAIPFTEKFICSVVIGDDLIPRLSMQSMQRFKSNILQVLEQCEYPKWEILLKGFFKLLCSKRSTTILQEEIVDYANNAYESDNSQNSNGLSNGGHPDHPPTPKLAAIATPSDSFEASPDEPLIVAHRRSLHSYTEERPTVAININTGHGAGESVCVRKLLCPGRILHVTQRKGNGETETMVQLESNAVWRHYEYFNEIWLSSNMINDHMPYSVAAILKEMADSIQTSLVDST